MANPLVENALKLGHDFPKPDPESTLWRYLSLAKYASLLHTGALWYSRLSALQDWAEGTAPTGLWAMFEEEIRVSARDKEMADFALAQWRGIPEMARRTCFVCCWCESPIECEAQWRIYGSTEGVALRTTAKRLRDAVPKGHVLGSIRYEHHTDGQIGLASIAHYAMWKRRQFAYEHEVRLLHMDLTKLVDAPGFAQPVALHSLLTDVVVSPYAPAWVFDCVCGLTAKYLPSVPVKHSEMIR